MTSPYVNCKWKKDICPSFRDVHSGECCLVLAGEPHAIHLDGGFVLLSISGYLSLICKEQMRLLISVYCERSDGETNVWRSLAALFLFTLRCWIRDLLPFYCLFTQSSGSGNASLRCSMSSSADFSDDEEYSLKSGSVSPAPGDTLPWNLPRHERSKRKIQGGSVLDPAERAVLRIAGRNPKYLSLTAPMHIHSLGSYRENGEACCFWSSSSQWTARVITELEK